MGSEKVRVAGANWNGPEEMTFREWAEYEGLELDGNDQYSFFSHEAAELFLCLAEARGFSNLAFGSNTTGSWTVADWVYDYREDEDGE